MKTKKLISNLKKEIEERYKKVRKDYQIYGEANNWDKKNIERATQKELKENDYTYQVLQAQLQFAEKLIEAIKKDILELTTTSDGQECSLTRGELNKIFDKSKSISK